MKDVDLDAGVLILRHTKGNKQRLVPMHASLTSIMNNYCMTMGLVGNHEAFLFPGTFPDVPMSKNAALHRFESIFSVRNRVDLLLKPFSRGQKKNQKKYYQRV